MLDTLVRDLRYAVRGLSRAPGFTIAVALTLALGIGTNTAIFSAVDQLLLRPLPYPDGDELVRIYETRSGEAGDGFDVSPANWLDWQRQSRTLDAIAVWRATTATLTGAGETERLQAQIVSAEFFPVLGVAPLLGRTIAPDDDRPGTPRVAVISHALWQQRFASDPAIVGKSIQLDEMPVEVVGVMPAGFRFLFPDTAVWLPYQLSRSDPWRDTAGRFLWTVARLRPNVTLAEAQAEMASIARRLGDTYEFNRGTTVALVPLRKELVGDVYSSVVVLYGAVLVLFSIACFNAANLLLARATSRRRETLVRLSLGARRSAIVRQAMAESVLLAAVGGALGLVFAQWMLGALLTMVPTELTSLVTVVLDRSVLLYAFALSLVTGLAVGVVPGVAATRASLTSGLRQASHTVTRAPRVQQALVVAQVAMTVMLLCGAGLLLRTVLQLNATDTGFSRQNLLTLSIGLPDARYDDGRAVAFVHRVRERLAALPGATATAAAWSLPVTGGIFSGTGFHILGQPELPRSERPSTAVRVVTSDYFHTLGVPIVRGREFTADDERPKAELVFVVNEAFARQFLGGVDPLTASVSVNVLDENPYGRIVGVVGDVSEGSVRSEARPTVFYSHGHIPVTDIVLFVRAAAPEALSRPAAAAIRELDPNVSVANIRTFEAVLSESVARERLTAVVSGAFALSGLLLASLGLYGLLAFVVSAQTREIGVRLALGARLGRLLGDVLGSGLGLVALGAAIGVVASLAVSRALQSLLFGVTAYDPVTYAAVLALLLGVTVLATFVPARRAIRVDPAIALRAE
jgi:predicted permease